MGRHRGSTRQRQHAFTLLEVMVAVAIFGLIGVASGQVLSRVLQANEMTQQRAERLAALQRGVTLLERDLLQYVQRGIRDEFGDPRPPLILQAGGVMELTHQGWRNPLDLPRSDLQRVAWSLDPQGTLTRTFWSVLDRAQDTEPRTQAVLEGVDGFEVLLLDAAGTQWSYWPASDEPLPGSPAAADQPPLLAAQITLQLAPYGAVTRLIPLPDPAPLLVPAGQTGQGPEGEDDGDGNGQTDAESDDGAGTTDDDTATATDAD